MYLYFYFIYLCVGSVHLYLLFFIDQYDLDSSPSSNMSVMVGKNACIVYHMASTLQGAWVQHLLLLLFFPEILAASLQYVFAFLFTAWFFERQAFSCSNILKHSLSLCVMIDVMWVFKPRHAYLVCYDYIVRGKPSGRVRLLGSRWPRCSRTISAPSSSAPCSFRYSVSLVLCSRFCANGWSSRSPRAPRLFHALNLTAFAVSRATAPAPCVFLCFNILT